MSYLVPQSSTSRLDCHPLMTGGGTNFRLVPYCTWSNKVPSSRRPRPRDIQRTRSILYDVGQMFSSVPSMKVLLQIHPSHLRHLDASWFAPTVINALFLPIPFLSCWSSQWGSMRLRLLLSSPNDPLLFPVHTLTISSLYSHPATTTRQSPPYLPFSEISMAISPTAPSPSDTAATVNGPSSDHSIENWPVLGEHQLSWRSALKHQTWSIGHASISKLVLARFETGGIARYVNT
jgi:hypothetical protein